MQLGFIGTGEITAAMVRGLCSGGDTSHSIVLSPRNPAIAAELGKQFSSVSIASSNQDVVDRCKTVVVALRVAVVRAALSELRFCPDHHVISVLSSLSIETISELVAPATRVTRAVPLPSVALRIGPTALYPSDPAAIDLFAQLGTSFAVSNEDKFDTICAATGTVAAFLAFMGGVVAWLAAKGVPERQARDYVARMFGGATSEAAGSPQRSFQSLARVHATVGGINELFLRYLVERGFLENVSNGLDAIANHIKETAAGHP